MHVAYSLNALPKITAPCGITIGSFDGVHLGHQYLIKMLRELIGQSGVLAVLTFSNHPADVIPGRKAPPPLYSQEEKLKLLEQAGVDLAIVLEFTPSFSQKSYDEFLRELSTRLPFSYLVLGKGATFGKDRQGNEENIIKLESELHFHALYLDKKIIDGEECSSGLIRNYLQKGDLAKVATFLGRPYTM